MGVNLGCAYYSPTPSSSITALHSCPLLCSPPIAICARRPAGSLRQARRQHTLKHELLEMEMMASQEMAHLSGSVGSGDSPGRHSQGTAHSTLQTSEEEVALASPAGRGGQGLRVRCERELGSDFKPVYDYMKVRPCYREAWHCISRRSLAPRDLHTCSHLHL